MDYRHLGRSGLRVSWLGLGTMNFGMTTEEPTAFKIMDRAVDMGINFFDTADVYGGLPIPGHGEGLRRLGGDHRSLARSGRRPG
ncbi:aldo/keto reductase [Nonomuraea sp. NPDC049129]|uniref:aldo/keto reductase n=1 Tax=Nonomuraea sp. NPDC049129 TaxID=3155272 RepID=UPI0033FB35FC